MMAEVRVVLVKEEVRRYWSSVGASKLGPP
jgi:hypothetical protein